MRHPYPGNVRELRNCIESSVVMASGNLITIDDLPPGIRINDDEHIIRVPSGSSLADAERILIRETLAAQAGNKSKTAEILKIGRKTFVSEDSGLRSGIGDMTRQSR